VLTAEVVQPTSAPLPVAGFRDPFGLLAADHEQAEETGFIFLFATTRQTSKGRTLEILAQWCSINLQSLRCFAAALAVEALCSAYPGADGD